MSSNFVPDPLKYPVLTHNNICLITLTLEQFYSRLRKVITEMKKLLDSTSESKINTLVNFAYHQSIARTYSKILFLCLKRNTYNLLYTDLEDSEWETLAPYIEIIDWGNTDEFKKLKNKKKLTAEQISAKQYANLTDGFIKFAYKDCPEPKKQFIMNINLEMARRMLGAGDKFESLIENSTPKINTHKLVYVPKVIEDFATVTDHKLLDSPRATKVFLHTDASKFDSSTHVQVRVMNHGVKLSLDQTAKSVKEIDYAVVHCHGGGFVTCSSLTH